MTGREASGSPRSVAGDHRGLGDLDPEVFPVVDFAVGLWPGRGSGEGHSLRLVDLGSDLVVCFPRRDGALEDIAGWADSDIPLGSLDEPFAESGDSWAVLIWQAGGWVHVMQGDGESSGTCFRVAVGDYLARWRELVSGARELAHPRSGRRRQGLIPLRDVGISAVVDFDVEDFPTADGFTVELHDGGSERLCRVSFVDGGGDLRVDLAYWDDVHVDRMLPRWLADGFPSGTREQPFIDVDQCWVVGIWQDDEWVFIVEGGDHHHFAWMKVPVERYSAQWLDAARRVAGSGDVEEGAD